MRILRGMVLLVFASSAVLADDKDQAKDRSEQAYKLTLDSATTYEFSLAGDKPTALALRKEPVLRWSNPERGEIYGNVFVWTDRGRPEAIGSLFKWYSPYTHMSHEFVSLSLGKIAAKRDGAETWRTEKPGVTLLPIPEAPRPADTAPGRLSQMRQLARQFTARSVDREKNQLELRQLTQPIYRYDRPSGKQSPEWLDGALFVFVQGTDPEVFLLLEARPGDSGVAWHYGLARMNSIEFHVAYKNSEVWHLDVLPQSDIYSHREPYTSFLFK